MKLKKLKKMPEYLKCMLGDDISNPITSGQLRHLINCMEIIGIDEMINYPIIFKSAERGSPVMMAGFTEFDFATFIVDGQVKFTCDEEVWNLFNFNDLQDYIFSISDNQTFYLLEGTFSGNDL